MSAAAAAAALECEAQVLRGVMYRNRNQHGRADYWKRLQHVRRLLRELALPEMVAMAQAAQQDLLALRSSSSKSEKKLGLLRAKGRALQVAAGQCALVMRACLGCSDALAVEVVQGYFLNLTILLLALLGRIHALVRHAGVMALYVGQALLRHGLGDGGKLLQQQQQQQEEGGIPRRLAGALLALKQRRTEAGTSTAAGVADEEEDDLGVALGPALAALAPPSTTAAAARALTTRVIPAAKANARADGQGGGVGGQQGRALLAAEYSSSSEEEDGDDEVAAAATAVQEEEGVREAVEDEGAMGFVIDREPEPPQPPAPPPPDAEEEEEEESGLPSPAKKGKGKKAGGHHGKPSPSALSAPFDRQPKPAVSLQPSLPLIGRKRKKKQLKARAQEQETAPLRGKAGLLDDIDAIFQLAGAASNKKPRKKQQQK